MWIEYHEALRDHWKIARLAVQLSVRYPEALGVVSCLWLWAVGNAKEGDLSKFTSAEIATACRWHGEPQLLHESLKLCHLIDKNECINDWKEHGNHYHTLLRKRVAKYRLGKRDVTLPETLLKRATAVGRLVGRSVGSKRRTTEAKNDGFAAFWQVWPPTRRLNKQDAVKAWQMLNPDVTLQAIILQAVTRWSAHPDWQKENGKFIPHPSRWLAKRRWEDEWAEPPHRKTLKELLSDPVTPTATA